MITRDNKATKATKNKSQKVISCELKRSTEIMEGRSVKIEDDLLEYFEGQVKTVKSKMLGKLINESLRHIKNEVESGALIFHLTK